MISYISAGKVGQEKNMTVEWWCFRRCDGDSACGSGLMIVAIDYLDNGDGTKGWLWLRWWNSSVTGSVMYECIYGWSKNVKNDIRIGWK